MTPGNHTLKDLLLNDSFRKWVFDNDPEAALFWEQWLHDHPDQLPVAEEARELLLLVNFNEASPGDTTQAEVWNKIKNTIGQEESKYVPENETRPSPPFKRNRTLYLNRKGKNRIRYAAVLTGFLIVSAFALYMYYSLPVRQRTDYGERKTVVLPDNSVVELNANSTLRYARKWILGQPREVWLTGEAFFNVVHQGSQQRFLVHTDDVTVQVVGTRFNVNSRRIDTKVVLNSGSVALHLAAAANNGKDKPADLVMKPGELVSWSSQTGNLLTRKVDPERYSSWVNNLLIFKDTPIAEVSRSLEENFGLHIRLEGDSLLSETFTGTVPMDNVDVFFETLSRSLNIQIINKGNTVYIEKK